MKDIILQLIPQLRAIEDSEIKDSKGQIVGYQSSVVLNDDTCIGTGTHEDKNMASTIAVSESIERLAVRRLYDDVEMVKSFSLEKYASTSGFAVGFDSPSTRYRAICEGLERWIWSYWIDSHCQIEECKITQPISKLSGHFINDFDSYRVFEKVFSVDKQLLTESLKITIFIGYSGQGVFPGSRVSTANDDRLTHAVIEAWRHKKLYHDLLKNSGPQDIIEQRIVYFGKDAHGADKQINMAQKQEWPQPQLALLRGIELYNRNVYLWRALFKNFLPWDIGEIGRFVY